MFKTYFQDVSKTCLQDVFRTCLQDVSKIYLQDVFKKSSAKQFFVFQDGCKTPWKTKNFYAEEVLKTNKCLLGWFFNRNSKACVKRSENIVLLRYSVEKQRKILSEDVEKGKHPTHMERTETKQNNEKNTKLTKQESHPQPLSS